MTDKDPQEDRALYDPSLGETLNKAIREIRNWVRSEIRSLRTFIDTTIEVKLSDVPDRIETLEGAHRDYDLRFPTIGADLRRLSLRLETHRSDLAEARREHDERLKKLEAALSAPAFTKAMTGAIANAVGAVHGLPVVTADYSDPVDQPDGFADVDTKLLAKDAVRRHRTKARREHLTMILGQLVTFFETEKRAVADVRFRMDPNSPSFDSIFIDASGRDDRTGLSVNVRDLVELALFSVLPR